MAVVLTVEIGITIGLAGYWACSYRRRLWDLFRHRAARGRSAHFGRRSPLRDRAEHGARSPRRMGRFSIVSVVAMDRTAIVAYRERDRERPRGLKWTAFRRRSRARRPHLLTTDQTLVLRVADDAEAERAWVLLDQWRQDGTVLCLRPTGVPSTVNLSDDMSSTLQAVLSTD